MGQQLCGKSPLVPEPLVLAPDEACIERNDEVLDRLLSSGSSTLNEDYGAYLLQVASAASAETVRGNAHLKDAVDEASAMADGFDRDSLGDFSGAGARTLAAVEEAEGALSTAEELLDQENLGWSQDIQDAREGLSGLQSGLKDVDTEMVADVDARLGLDLVDRTSGDASERIEHVQVVAEVHLAAGLDLQGLADLLGDIHPDDAKPIARELAADYGLFTEAGTQDYYNRFMEDSAAAPELKGWFAHALGIDVADSASYYEYDEEAELCGLNEAGSTRALEEARAAREAEAKRAVLDLGVVKDPLGGGFAAVAGRVADLLVTDDGEKAGLEIDLKLAIPLPSGIDATVRLKLGAELARAGKQREVSAGFEFLLGAQVDAVVAKAFVEAGVIGRIKSSGDSFDEGFRLLILGLYDRMHRTSPSIADAAFGGEKMEAVSDGMDADDSVEYSLGLKVAAGASTSWKNPDDNASVGAEGEALWGTKLTGGVGEQKGLDVKRDDVSSVKAKVAATAGRFGVGASIQGRWVNGEFATLTAEAEASATVPPESFSREVTGGKVVAEMIGSMQKAANQGAAAFDRTEPGYRRMASFGKQLGRHTGADKKLESAARDAIKEKEGLGLDVTYKITVTGEGGPKGDPKVTISLAEETAFKKGGKVGKAEYEAKASTGREIAKVELT